MNNKSEASMSASPTPCVGTTGVTSEAPKERPLLFSAPMIRALLAGQKTVTRRIMKPQPVGPVANAMLSAESHVYGWHPRKALALGEDLPFGTCTWWPSRPETAQVLVDRCPYGKPGDRLWVRETTRSYFLPNMLTGEPTNALCGLYSADEEPVLTTERNGEIAGFDIGWWYSRPVCPAIHMPRYASRITLEITSVRVERVQDITEEDAKAEGVKSADYATGRECVLDPSMGSYRLHFQSLWDSINGKRADWKSNPWVWVVSFRRAGAE